MKSNTNNNVLTVGSLFSGIGGIELGFEKAGFKTLWFCENEPYAQSILRKHWPHAVIYGDITKVDWRTVPAVDILTGGFPCTDISFAGKGAGIKGSRSGLWTYYYEAIRVLRPRYAFIENVSALLGRGLDVVLADLAAIFYDAEGYCVPASAVGAPHQRDRLFIIAYLPISRDGRLSVLKRDKGKKDFNIDGKSKTVSNTESTGEMPIQQQGQGNGIITIHKELPNAVSVRRGRRTKIQSFSEDAGEIKGRNGSEENMAYPNSERLQNGKQKSGKTRPFERSDATNVSDSECLGCGQMEFDDRGRTKGKESIHTIRKCDKRQEREIGRWSTESRICGVAHGIPNRVQRIRCLGNAVVPQVAEVFAESIKKIEFGW